MSNEPITAKSILEAAVKHCGSISAVARKTKINRSTLKHIRNGDTETPHADTLAKLLRLAGGR